MRNGSELTKNLRRLFILGQPGAGKTTFLKHLVMQAVRGEIDAIPIFVSLKDWSDSSLDIMSFLVRQFEICNFPDAYPFIELILASGRAIILFDGLDEVGSANQGRLLINRAIREFAEQYQENLIVVTCRTAATEFVFERFNYCEVADFTDQQINSFILRWFQESEVKRTAFLKAFKQPENERLRDLARRPLLLTMLCITFNETMSFPQRRAELYEEAIDALLKKWDSSRDIQRDIVYRKLSLGYKRQLLCELAFETFKLGEFFIHKSKVIDYIVQFLRRLPPISMTEDVDGSAVLRSIEAQHGLIIERAYDIYCFSHLTFQEYFTARYIANRQNLNILRDVIAQTSNPQWREVLLLTVSLLDHDSVALFFQLWKQQLQSMLATNSLLVNIFKWVAREEKNTGVVNLETRSRILTVTL